MHATAQEELVGIVATVDLSAVDATADAHDKLEAISMAGLNLITATCHCPDDDIAEFDRPRFRRTRGGRRHRTAWLKKQRIEAGRESDEQMEHHHART